MALPDVDLRIVDGALGLLPEATDRVQLVLGTATKGATNKIFALGSKEALLRTFEAGPLVEACALKLDAGGGPVLALRIATADAGEVGPVAELRGAPVAFEGVPFDAASLLVRVTTKGERGVARFVWSVDAGETLSVETVTAPSVPLGATGLRATFAEGLYVEGATYSAKAIGPSYTEQELTAAFDAVLRDPREWGLVHILGSSGTGTDEERAKAAAALAGLVAGRMTEAETRYRYARAVIEAPAVDDAVLLAAFANVVTTRVSVVAGEGAVTSPLDGTRKRRSLAWVVTLPLLRKALGKDAAQVRAEPGTGPLSAVLTAIDRDERETPNLDSQRFVTVRTFLGKRGYFVTNFPLLSGTGSDFKYLHLGQIVDTACKVARGVLLEYLSLDLELNATGTLTEAQAQAIDQALEDALRAALVQPGHVNAVFARTNRTDDVLATETLRGSFRIQPKFYPKKIEFDVGFTKTVPGEG